MSVPRQVVLPGFPVRAPMHGTRDYGTSVAAARRARDSAPRLRDRVLAALERLGDATDDELAQALPDANPPSLVKRRGELVADGLVVDTGRRRPTRRGSQAVVWAVVP